MNYDYVKQIMYCFLLKNDQRKTEVSFYCLPLENIGILD